VATLTEPSTWTAGQVLSLRGLDLEATGTLLEQTTGTVHPPDVIESVWQETGGSPARLLERGRELARTAEAELAERTSTARTELAELRDELATVVARAAGERAPAPRTDSREPPYKGLLRYEPEDAAWFFGREQLVADAVARLLTGRFLAVDHWGVEPDMVLIAKALSGGHVPVGAVLTRKRIYDKIFDRMDRAVVHGSTFAKNDLAMAAGLATLDVIETEGLISRAERLGDRLRLGLSDLIGRYEFLRAVRGKGLMIGIEFGPPTSLKLKASWNLLESANKGLFCQLITIPLFAEHKIVTQVAGHASHTIKLLCPLVITEADCDWIVSAFDNVIAATHRVPGAIWSLGKTLVGNAVAARG